jgi:hypothetical protein
MARSGRALPAPRRVFLSYTSELAESSIPPSYVAAAELAVSRAGDAATHMAHFTAADEDPATYCRRVVSTVHVYVGIIA